MVESLEDLISSVFPNVQTNFKNQDWLQERALLVAKNLDVNITNNNILQRISGCVTTYKSIDTITREEDIVNYPVEFLNSLDLPGFPPHILQLKVGVPIILLRNIDPPRLCNGTRLAVKKLHNNLIEGTIITGNYKGTDVLIPRIPMIPTDLPFDFKRLQFPIRLAFAMTINKAQGQSLQGMVKDLLWFYVGAMNVIEHRVTNPENLREGTTETPKCTDNNIEEELELCIEYGKGFFMLSIYISPYAIRVCLIYDDIRYRGRRALEYKVGLACLWVIYHSSNSISIKQLQVTGINRKFIKHAD
ncbi:ATP-dependent DNA helicase Pif1-like [Haematobia irritans]|uniref:ATP-dependent DNA helicase Pif1-like n=1 Tax=Haematobia irritans TaxID=7368 RepID=UPI003F506EBF